MFHRVFVLFSALAMVFSVPALADGQKSFDTSMVPKKGGAPPPVKAPSPAKAPPPQQRSPAQPPAQAPSPIADIINERNSSKGGSGMQSKTMPIPDDLKEPRKKPGSLKDSEFLDEPEEDEKSAEKESASVDKSKKPFEQAIWDKYKALANGEDGGNNMKSYTTVSNGGDVVETPDDKNNSDKEDDELTEEEKAAKDREKMEAQANVLGRALNEYRNNKDNKKISSRSYGNLNN